MRTERLNLMISPEEKADIASRAEKLNLSTSELVRRAVSAYDPAVDEAELMELAHQFLRSVEATEKMLDRTIARLEGFDERLEKARVEARAAQLKEGSAWPFELHSDTGPASR